MLRHVAIALLLLSWCACKPAEEGHVKAIIGAVLIDGAGGPPLSNSVVVVGSGRIRGAGAHSSIPIPADADKIDCSGKYLVPALVDICDRADPPGLLRPTTPEEARAQVAQLAARQATAIHIGKLPRAVAEAVLEAARDARIPVTGHIATQAEVRLLVDNGTTNLVGMIRDTEDLDPVLVSRLRDLRIVVAPSLANAGAGTEVAKRNARRLFEAGVPLAVASEGGDPLREAALLVEAGVPPLDVLVAATHNGGSATSSCRRRISLSVSCSLRQDDMAFASSRSTANIARSSSL